MSNKERLLYVDESYGIWLASVGLGCSTNIISLNTNKLTNDILISTTIKMQQYVYNWMHPLNIRIVPYRHPKHHHACCFTEHGCDWDACWWRFTERMEARASSVNKIFVKHCEQSAQSKMIIVRIKILQLSLIIITLYPIAPSRMLMLRETTCQPHIEWLLTQNKRSRLMFFFSSREPWEFVVILLSDSNKERTCRWSAQERRPLRPLSVCAAVLSRDARYERQGSHLLALHLAVTLHCSGQNVTTCQDAERVLDAV